MIKLLGLADIFCALVIYGTLSLPLGLCLTAGGYLALKGLAFLFSGDLGSLVDVIAGLILIASAFVGAPQILLTAIAICIGIKGLVSLF